MAVYLNLTIKTRIKIQDPRPDNIQEELTENTELSYPFDCEELERESWVTVEDAD